MGFAVAAVWLAGINLATWLAFRHDKMQAVAREWRVPESTLLFLAVLGGWPGARLAQRRFRHKTRKQPFRRLLGLSGALSVVVLGVAAMVAADVLAALSVLLVPGAGG